MKPFITCLLALLASFWCHAEGGAGTRGVQTEIVDSSSLRGKVLCGYQGWFRCPGDSAKQGWIHWSRDPQRIEPKTLSFELWPDMTEYPAPERFAAPGLTNRDDSQCFLFSSAQPETVRRHFEWMRQYGIDGAWLQHFLVDLPGGPLADRYASRRQVLDNVRAAARETGRTWAIAFDVAGMPTDGILSVLTNEWTRLEKEGVTRDDRYLHEQGLPVVEVWGFYYQDPHNV